MHYQTLMKGHGVIAYVLMPIQLIKSIKFIQNL